MGVILGTSILLWGLLGAGASSESSEIAPDELSILQLCSNDRVLDDSLICLQRSLDDEPLLPLVSLAQDLGFRLHETERGVEGTINGPSDVFRLNSSDRQVDCRRASSKNVPDDRLSVQGGVTFVAPDLLGRWLGVEFEVRPRQMRVLVRSKRPLPCDRRSFVSAPSTPEDEKSDLPIVASRTSGMPTTDLRLGVQMGGGATSASAGIAGRGAFGGTDAQFSTSGAIDEPFGSVRVRFQRPVGSSSLEVGDVSVPTSNQLTSGGWGRGIALTRTSTERERTSNVVEGDAPAGWDVEIYLGEDLVGVQTADEKGRFRFELLPTPSSMTRYDLVFYGPNGEVRRSKRTVYTGSFLLRKGERKEGAWLVQTARSLLPDSSYGDRSTVGNLQALYSIDQGVTDNLSLRTSIGRSPQNGDMPTTGTVEARTLQGKWQIDASGLVQDRGGMAAVVSLSSKLGKANLQVDHGVLDRFVGGSSYGDTRNWRNLTNIRLSAPLRLGGTPTALSAMLQTHDENSFRAYRAYGSLFVPTRRWHLWTSIDSIHDRYSGSVQGQTTLRTISPRSPQLDLRYSLESMPSISLATVSYDLHRAGSNRSSLGFGYDESVAGHAAIRLGLSRDVGPLNLGIDIVAGRLASPRIGLSIGMGLQEDARSRSLRAVAPGSTSGAKISAFAFLDNNGSGRFDAGDVPLPGVGFLVDRSRRPGSTGRSGMCELTNVRTGGIAEIGIDESTLEDPDYVPTPPVQRFRATAGSSVAIDFPIVPCGEIEGRIDAHGIQRIELHAENGKTDRTTTSDEDGTFVFSQVPPGAYEIRIGDAPPTRVVVKASAIASVELAKR